MRMRDILINRRSEGMKQVYYWVCRKHGDSCETLKQPWLHYAIHRMPTVVPDECDDLCAESHSKRGVCLIGIGLAVLQ